MVSEESHEMTILPSNPPPNHFHEKEEEDHLPLITSDEPSSPYSSPSSGIPSAVFNLSTSVIGAGIMALPATTKVLGLIPGIFSIFLMGFVSEFSLELLLRFSISTKSQSYSAAVAAALPKPSKLISDLCVILNNAGVLIVYLIIIGDVLSGSERHVGVLHQIFGPGFYDHHRSVVVLITLLFFLAPLCFLRKIDSLAPSSAASVALAVVFVLVCCFIAVVKVFNGTFRPPRLGPDFRSKVAVLDLLVVIPIMTNAYICHFNVQPIYNELKHPSFEKMTTVGRITMVLCVAIYLSTAVSGYLLFGDDTDSDILTNFDKDLGVRFGTALNYIVRIGYIFHLILVFPVIHFSLRQTVAALVFTRQETSAAAHSQDIAPNKIWGLTALLLLLIYIGSTTIPNIWVAFKFTGATTGLSLGFIFPALIALRLNKEGGGAVLQRGEKIASWVMLVMAIIVGVIGVVGNVYSLKRSSD